MRPRSQALRVQPGPGCGRCSPALGVSLFPLCAGKDHSRAKSVGLDFEKSSKEDKVESF